MKQIKWLALILLIQPVAWLNFYLLYLGLLWYAHDFEPDFLAIDSCLDHGGKWNYKNDVCEGQKTKI